MRETQTLSVGTLCKFTSPDDGAVRIGRILNAYTGPEYLVTSVERSRWCVAANILEVFSSPTTDTADLKERRDLLRKLLQRTIDAVVNTRHDDMEKIVRRDATYSILVKLSDTLFKSVGGPDYRWFWDYVTVSKDNPRHFAYSFDEQWVDTDERRKHSSVKSLLKKAVHKGMCEFTPEEIELISNAVGQHFPDTMQYSFEVLSGEGVCRAYRDSPEGWRSCMTVHWDNYVRWYAENPDKVSVVRVTQGGIYVGRAMLWKTDEGRTVLDRVYPSDGGPQIGALARYAESQGWDYRTNHGCDYARFASGDNYTVTLRRPSSGEYPYVDSFRFTDDCPRTAKTLQLNTAGDGAYAIHCTNGRWEGNAEQQSDDEEPYCVCSVCGDGLGEDECHTNEAGDCHCGGCYSERYVYLQYWHNGRRIETEAHRDDARECSECHEYRLSEHFVEVDDVSFCESCAEDHVTWCEECEESILRDGACSFDDRTLCESCYNDIPDCSECGKKVAESDLEEGVCPTCPLPSCTGEALCPCRSCSAVPTSQLALEGLNENDTTTTNDNTGRNIDNGAQAEEAAESTTWIDRCPITLALTRRGIRAGRNVPAPVTVDNTPRVREGALR
jgi:hypothetical protein